MNTKLTILCFLGIITIVSCGWINEKKVQEALNKKLPDGIIKSAAKAIVHKMAKNQFGCFANVDVKGDCKRHCKSEDKEGICHGTKCKCGVPISYL
uniref:Antimicrobial peptide n=1 Tax=Hadrurus spadix TaxID=141984 RepID=A0A1W7RB11_9SCOR